MKWNVRPTAMLMRDEWFHHRDIVTGEELGDRTELTDWDFAIIHAFETIEAYTNQNGIFKWHLEDPQEKIGAVLKIDPFQQDVDSITNNPKYKRPNGAYYVPDVRSMRGDESMWTYAEWMESQRAEMAANAEDGKME